ncbi:MAG: LysM peptidoglycan-binding domain-containing protein [Planctomycetota bacterium]
MSNGLRRLFGFSAIVVLAMGMIVLSGCGRKCKCHTKSNSCSSCSSCGVSDNSSTGCSTCSTCSTGTTSYDRVGAAPASLSEPISTQSSSGSYASQPTYTPPPAYSTGSNYSGTNTSLSRPGDSQDLPLFSKPAPQPTYRASEQPAFQPSVQQQPTAALIAPSSGAGQYHTLKQGETVYALSRQYGVKPKAILEANHFSDPNHLSVGTKVLIPGN